MAVAAGSVFERLRFRLEYIFLVAYLALIEALPLEFAIRATGWAFVLLSPLSRRSARTAQNIARALPEMDSETQAATLRGVWRNYGMTVAETFLMDTIARDPRRIVLDEASLEAMQLAKKNGVVFVSPHLGNWEVPILPLATAGVHYAAVYTRVKNPLYESIIFKRRKPYYPGGLHPKGALAANALARHLRGGGSVGVMADLRDDHQDCLVPFFGRYAPSTVFPATLARHYQRRLIAECLVRTGPGRFIMKIEHIDVPRTSDRRSDIHIATARIQSCFERWIRQHPDQWLCWTHRRYER
jgi:KDO2-lipid IV(A) lauroyltransferase